MARWVQPAPVASLVDELVEALAPILDPVTEALGRVGETLHTAAQIVEIIEALATPDPLAAIVGAAVAQFQSFVLNLLATDIYVLPMMPLSWADLLRPYSIQDALNNLSASTNDTLDPNRPVADENAAFATITIVVGANNWHDFTNLLKLFGRIFDGSEFNKWSRLFNMRFNFDSSEIQLPRRMRNSQGTPWDWSRTNWLEQVPGLSKVVERALELANGLNGVGRGLTEGLNELSDLLIERAEFLRRVLQELSEIATLLEEWRELLPRMYVLATASAPHNDGSPGGVAGYVDTLMNAGGRPEFALTAGLTFVAFGPDAAANVNAVGRLIGLKTQEVDDAIENIENL